MVDTDDTSEQPQPAPADAVDRDDPATAGDAGEEARAGSGSGTRSDADSETAAGGAGGRDVVVPLRLYKTITVFSTLIAIVTILLGFVLLDRGTQRATAGPEEVSLPVVAFGLALIVGGSAVYAFSTRFRTEGMGKSKDDTAESSDNG
jgi:hypothetical protein